MKNVLITAGILIAIAVIGTTLVSSTQTYEPSVVTVATSSMATTDASASAERNQAVESAASKMAACTTKLQADVTKNKTSYEKGTILVSFERGTSESQISAVLKDHSLTFQGRTGTSTSPQIWGTANVAAGKEFSTICELQADTRVKYAGLNPMLELHE